MGELKQAGVEVVGASFDSVESHRKFIQDHQLNFTLLADTDGKIADAFGARSEGRKSARRVSFLIDRQGRIQHVTDSPDAKVHLSQMKEAVAKLKQ
jgi:peroxiredoxin Q/BCP